MTRSKTSPKWLKEHFNDIYVKMAQENGYRSRSSYKLLEIQNKDHLIRKDMTIIDLGSSPGGWSQVALNIIGEKGILISTDILKMVPIPGAYFIQGDFTEEKVLSLLLDKLQTKKVDLVLSDLAPNMTGLAAIDIPRSLYLCEIALDFAKRVLRENGSFLTKVFQGEGSDRYYKEVSRSFKHVRTRKPLSSRTRSREQYLLGRGFLMI